MKTYSAGFLKYLFETGRNSSNEIAISKAECMSNSEVL
jgi:hypothetical protein